MFYEIKKGCLNFKAEHNSKLLIQIKQLASYIFVQTVLLLVYMGASGWSEC